jgi:acetyl esterase/lipase
MTALKSALPIRLLATALCAVLPAAAPLPALAAAATQEPEVIALWPGTPPGTENWTGEETVQTLPLPSGSIRMIGNVTRPTLTVYRPPAGKANGTAMLVTPGGGFVSLAIDHEGIAVAQWLAERGVTAFVLKYRVKPNPAFRIPGNLRKNPELFAQFKASFSAGIPIAVADATQAIRYLRANAGRFAIAPDRIGMIGFSAGAITTMGAVMNEAASDRPNFAAPIYGAMDDKAPPAGAPPLFIAVTQDDPAVPATESLKIYASWTAAELPAELHVYERGGHGFGMRTLNQPVDGWATAFAAWMKSHGWLDAPASQASADK